MLATLKLLHSYFWKTIYGPVLAFIFPVILLAILGNILRLEYIYPGIIALAMLFLGLIALPLAIMELKSSSLFKYIGSSPVNPVKFTMVVIGFYAFVAICTGFVICIATMAIFSSQTFPSSGFRHGVLGGIFTLKGSFSFYIGCAIHLAFVIIAGLAISTFAKTPQQALTIGLVIALPSMFLSGMVLSIDVIGESPVMNWISRFIPFRYSTGNLIVAATPVDQLDSAVGYWLGKPYDTHKSINEIINHVPNNYLDNLIWPYRSLTDPVIKNGLLSLHKNLLPAGVVDQSTYDAWMQTLPNKGNGYEAWYATNIPREVLQSFGLKISDPTLYNLLVQKWDAMELTSDNNIFNWLENWGVRKIPSVDTLTDFVTKFFQGVDSSGATKGGSDIAGRVAEIGKQISGGHFEWLEMFTHQSNFMYYQADRILNVCLPILLSGLGSWYVFKKFNWSTR